MTRNTSFVRTTRLGHSIYHFHRYHQGIYTVNWLPSPPTDNLYKFMAISGVYLLLGLLAFFSWLGYLQFQIEREGKLSQAYFFSVQMESQISARMSSIKAGRFSENKLEWTPPSATPEQEQKFLQIALENHRQTIQKNKDVVDRRSGEELEVMKAAGFFWVMPIYVLFAVGCPFFGFLRWYQKTQRPSEEAHILDCKLKELSIRKTEAEISLDRTLKEATIRKIEAEIRELSKSKRFVARR